MSAPLPLSVTTLADVAELASAAEAVEVPCGSGSAVWRGWGAGPPVVLLHGGHGSWTHWVRNIGALVAAGYRVWAPDMPGFGDSASPPVGDDADAIVEPLEAGLQQLLGERPCAVVGFSFGGIVGGLLAAARPARVGRLVLNGAGGLGLFGPSPVLRGWRHRPEGSERDAAHRHNLLALMLHEPAAADALAVRLQSTNAAADHLHGRRLARSDAVRAVLPTLRCPLFGIWGECDALYRGRIAELPAALAEAPGFAGLELIAGAGHWAAYERADDFNALLLKALQADAG